MFGKMWSSMQKPIPSDFPWVSAVKACGIAASALLLQLLVDPWTDNRAPFIFFAPALMYAAVTLGRGAALIVMATGALNYALLTPPVGSLRIESPKAVIALSVYLALGATMIIVGGRLRLVKRRADLAERRLRRSRAAQQQQLSDLQRLRATAMDNERRFAVALESSAVPFAILQPVRDAAGAIHDFAWEYANRSALLLLERERDAVVGRRVGDQLPEVWHDPELLPRLTRVVESNESGEFDMIFDTDRCFHVVASPLQGGAAVWFADISERKRQEAWLREADRRKDEFLAILAHELRNPLAPIRQAARVLSSAAASTAQKQSCQAVIERQVTHMSLLLDDLLDASRITRGTLLLRKEVVPLQTIVEAAVETARPHIEAKQHRLAVDLPTDALVVELDALRMAQVIGNLLTNAAKYTDPEGSIRLTAEVGREELCIRIADNGIGMSHEQMNSLFSMFSQLPSATGRSQGGLGIGLALSRALVEMHGGRLEAKSAGPGGGSEFTVRLPRVA